jgi:hypothetical protein
LRPPPIIIDATSFPKSRHNLSFRRHFCFTTFVSTATTLLLAAAAFFSSSLLSPALFRLPSPPPLSSSLRQITTLIVSSCTKVAAPLSPTKSRHQFSLAAVTTATTIDINLGQYLTSRRHKAIRHFRLPLSTEPWYHFHRVSSNRKHRFLCIILPNHEHYFVFVATSRVADAILSHITGVILSHITGVILSHVTDAILSRRNAPPPKSSNHTELFSAAFASP